MEENLDFFECMKNGEFKDGEKLLCVKIDMVVVNMNFCDLVIYCVRYMSYYWMGDEWVIYLIYDFMYG